MSGGVDTRPVPVSLLRWPKTRDLVTQYKGILMYLWAHPEQTACGCYLLPVDATAADLSMSSPSLVDAMSEFQRRKLIEMDDETGEVMLHDWFRWYTPRSPAARGAVEAAIKKIKSQILRKKVESTYKSIEIDWKGKDKGKGKEKEKDNEAAAPHAEACGSALSAAAPNFADKRKHPRRTKNGIECWYGSEDAPADEIESSFAPELIEAAVKSIKARENAVKKPTSPVPALVAAELEKQERVRQAKERLVTAEAAQQASFSIDPEAKQRGEEFLAKIRQQRQQQSHATQ